MYKLWATILKDTRILIRDKVGLILMFGMPIVLVLVVTSIQNSTFELVNKNKIPLLVCNRDTGKISTDLIQAIDKIGMFKLEQVSGDQSEKNITDRMHTKDALLAIVIPVNFSSKISDRAKKVAGKALSSFGLEGDTITTTTASVNPLTVFYHPILQESHRQSIQAALYSALQLVESKQILKTLYYSVTEKQMPDTMENEMINNKFDINEITITINGSRSVPNASQHNIPAWTIFAMFFVVISLGGSIVREKLSGSFIRLKSLPTNYYVALLSKQITYLIVTLLQAAVIFGIGVLLFPYFGLPVLNLPADISGLFFVSLICGWGAVSYAMCIGVFAQTQEQANGFGAVSIVILAAIGGLMVPSFAMPDSFKTAMKLSPLHWSLEAYYGLFLEGGKLKDVFINIIPLFLITLLLQVLTFLGLKMKKLI
jgi:ABC-2 type transport system permease protein